MTGAPMPPFKKLHEIATTSDAVLRLDYPCRCYKAGCAHEKLMKLLGWWKPKEARHG